MTMVVVKKSYKLVKKETKANKPKKNSHKNWQTSVKDTDL